jgi:hypothetical protein
VVAPRERELLLASSTLVDRGFAPASAGEAAGAGVPRKRLHRLYEPSRERRYADTLRLLEYMRDSGTEPMTGSEFVSRCWRAREVPACTRP